MASLTPKEIAELASSKTEELEDVRRKVSKIDNMMTAIVIVTFLGFLTLVIALGALVVEALRSKEASYAELVSKIDEQNSKTNMLIQYLYTKENNNVKADTVSQKQQMLP